MPQRGIAAFLILSGVEESSYFRCSHHSKKRENFSSLWCVIQKIL